MPEIIEKPLKCNLKIYIEMLKCFSALFQKCQFFKSIVICVYSFIIALLMVNKEEVT